jgi:hypothetical protein
MQQKQTFMLGQMDCIIVAKAPPFLYKLGLTEWNRHKQESRWFGRKNLDLPELAVSPVSS